MLNILFLAPRLPWPLDTGGKIRTYHLLAALGRHHRVTLLTFDDPEADATALSEMHSLGLRCELFPRPGRLRKVWNYAGGLVGPLPMTIRNYHSPRMERRVRQLAPSVQVIHCDHLHMAIYAIGTGTPFVLDEHNIETVIWRRFAEDPLQPRVKRLLFAEQAWLLSRLEARVAALASLVLLCSTTDEQALVSLSSGRPPRTRLVPNGVDLDGFSTPTEAVASGHAFFTGSMDWAPNEQAVLVFLDEIWPEVRRQLPALRFFVVGRNPGPRLCERSGHLGVEVTGTVPDVRPYMQGALALVVPMRVGGGTRLKILEAFAARVPVVSTAVGIEGIEARPGEHYLPAETPAEFAQALARLATEAELGPTLAARAFALAAERYAWRAIGDALAMEYTRRFSLGHPMPG